MPTVFGIYLLFVIGVLAAAIVVFMCGDINASRAIRREIEGMRARLRQAIADRPQ